MPRSYQGTYAGPRLNQIAFPLGGLGAGMFCVEGSGALSHFSLRHRPEMDHEPQVFSALCIKGLPDGARLLEGPVPSRKIFGPPGTGNGGAGKTYGLPRMAKSTFKARFPFAQLTLFHPDLPMQVELTAWSPFIPGGADESSLPVAGLEYRFVNKSKRRLDAVYSFHAANFMAAPKSPTQSIVRSGSGTRGFVLCEAGTPEKPHQEGAFAAWLEDPKTKVNCAWFRGGWYDALTMNWKAIAAGACLERAPQPSDPSFSNAGASLFLPFRLKPGVTQTIVLKSAWFVPKSNLREGREPKNACSGGACCEVPKPAPAETYRPWYASRFSSVEEVIRHWQSHYAGLRKETGRFTRSFYGVTLPPEIVDAAAANLTILKSPTVLREHSGRVWAWEGCGDKEGCCPGSCTHVWNYAQALPHLFPSLERTLRETEFSEAQDEQGHQNFRSSLPIRSATHDFHAAADGQLGGILKMYREWRISGDTQWLRRWWPRVQRSLEYCIRTWDPRERGRIEEPHHNTYDIEFWGPDGLCMSFYLGALKAAELMGQALGEKTRRYAKLYERGRRYLEQELFNGAYFEQKIQWQGLRASDPTKEKGSHTTYSDEARVLLKKEGPKYQYGKGCLSDGVLGAWLAEVCGVGSILDQRKVASHLRAVYRHNFCRDFTKHANPQRPTYAEGQDRGLLLCSWPRGGKLSLPFPYSEEVWTGIEYQVASHLLLHGLVKEALEIVRAVRDRYDGSTRNPYNEYECGHWYARAMSSYGLLQGYTGIRYDAVERVLTIAPRIKGNFRSFLATETGFGHAGVRKGKPFLEVHQGTINVDRIEYRR